MPGPNNNQFAALLIYITYQSNSPQQVVVLTISEYVRFPIFELLIVRLPIFQLHD